MRKTLILLMMAVSITAFSQEEKKLYNPELDGMKQIQEAVLKAKAESKQVFIQAGGNWCGWCILFNKFVQEDTELKNFIDSQYITVHLNWSRENENAEAMEYLGFPQRFGFPVFIILDEDGKRIHTQNSALLEEGKGYNRDQVFQFFKHWTRSALDPKSYTKK